MLGYSDLLAETCRSDGERDECMTKPIDADELIRRCAIYLTRRNAKVA